MCGISGFYSLSKKISGQDLKHMTLALLHRGPDADGFFVNEDSTVGLGHRRLSIIDLSAAANQPMCSHSGRYVMVFNGEVYNFNEIKKQLKITTQTASDTEVIIEAFEKMGTDFVHLLNGMFAITIYDKLQNKLYLFRDRLGVKPLYYFLHENNFAFGSEIKSLLQADYISRHTALNKNVVATFLYAGYVPEPYTFYQHIFRLPAGSYAVATGDSFTITSYWKPEEKISPVTCTDFSAAKETLKNLLISSVRYRMISDVPFGTFLSGGIDSSVVTAIAQNISATPVNTFSIGFKEARYNESEFARKVATHLGTKHHEFIVTETDALNLIERMMDAYDEPYADSSAIPTMLVSKLARQHVTMTLSGDGGDELFMGYGAYQWAKRLQYPLVQQFRGPLSASLRLLGNRYKRIAGVFDYSNPARVKSHIFSQEQYFFSEKELAVLLHKNLPHDILFNEQFSVFRQLSAAEEQALFDMKYYLKDDLLVKTDIATMQFSLENRTPFLDYRIVEFALNLSENLKNHHGTAKYLLKEVLYDFVPEEFFNRPKWGFSIPLSKWLKTDLHYLIEKYLNEEIVRSYGVVHFAEVNLLLQRFRKGEDFVYNRIWALILLHRWLHKHSGFAKNGR